MFSTRVQMSMPCPMLNIFNGGSHANNTIDIQEFMILPSKNIPFKKGLRMSTEVYMNLKILLSHRVVRLSPGWCSFICPSVRPSVRSHVLTSIPSTDFPPFMRSLIPLFLYLFIYSLISDFSYFKSLKHNLFTHLSIKIRLKLTGT